jgi:hypothetical protein
VLTVASNHRVDAGFGPREVRELAMPLPAHAWQIRSAGQGSKGLRWYEWALIQIDEPGPGQHRLLIRRNASTGELAFYRCWTPGPMPLAALVRVAGTRWRIEENFQAAKGLAALDQHQVRTWTSWHRWTILAMLAHAFLAVMAAAAAPHTSDQLNLLICNEMRHLFTAPVACIRNDLTHLLRWSFWRRRHQAQAGHTTTGGKPRHSRDHDLQLSY